MSLIGKLEEGILQGQYNAVGQTADPGAAWI